MLKRIVGMLTKLIQRNDGVNEDKEVYQLWEALPEVAI